MARRSRAGGLLSDRPVLLWIAPMGPRPQLLSGRPRGTPHGLRFNALGQLKT